MIYVLQHLLDFVIFFVGLRQSYKVSTCGGLVNITSFELQT